MSRVAVQKNGPVLQNIKEPKPEVRMTDVQHDGWAIKRVKDASLRLVIKEVLIAEGQGVDAPRPG